MIKCYKCGNEYTMDKMRMESSKMRLVCRNCLEGKQVVKQETKQAGKPVKAKRLLCRTTSARGVSTALRGQSILT